MSTLDFGAEVVAGSWFRVGWDALAQCYCDLQVMIKTNGKRDHPDNYVAMYTYLGALDVLTWQTAEAFKTTRKLAQEALEDRLRELHGDIDRPRRQKKEWYRR